MTIRYINKNQSSAGQNKAQIREFVDSLTIGRAGNSDILISDPSVDMEHARIYLEDEKLKVEDLSSSVGIQVNGVFLKHAALQSGDVLKIAGHSFTVDHQNTMWTIESHAGQKNTVQSAPIHHTAESLQIQSRFPRMRTCSLLLIFLVTVFYICIPLFSEDYGQYSSGTMSDSHAMFATDCQSCHLQPFQPIPDSACTSCHSLTEHFSADSSSPHPEPACVNCHMEHRRNKSLISNSNMHCVTCHASSAISEEVRVSAFGTHPEFSIPANNSKIRVNHKLHLSKELRGANGPVTLTCSDCHELDETGKRMRPVTFEERCQECHPLGFEARLPDTQAPHKDPDEVFTFLYAEYAKLYLDDQSTLKTDSVPRQKPGGKTPQQKAADKMQSAGLAFVREQIASDARAAESELFAVQACQLCHELSRFDTVPGEVRKSRFAISDPGLNRHWFDKAQFDHTAHDTVACESCHSGIARSEQEGEVHMPALKDCKRCHSDSDAQSKIKTSCAECHSYHDTVPLEHGRKRSINTIVEQKQ